MDTILEVFLGLILGAICMYWLYGFFQKKKSKELTVHQSHVLLEKIKSVCKLVSVEGDFAEIYKYENTKERFMSLVSSKKKALIVINAKAQIGYDLKKVVKSISETTYLLPFSDSGIGPMTSMATMWYGLRARRGFISPLRHSPIF